ncbi:cytochrome P450 [Croceitalea sp. MTPC5]|uniref:cytochrome P450 n=1 Tax=Croceitalea sp. MTPC5 TaxID=3056565 RepID=UPI002B3EFF42|nr:cytochrome P450 [Croceitalea sp. MTPC5]
MKKLPHVSALKVLWNSKEILKNPLPFHKVNFDKLGDTFRISIPGEGKVLFSRDPDFVKEVLQKKHRFYAKSKLQTQDLAKYIGYGLLTAEGQHWRTHRRMIQPAFHLKNLKSLLGIMQEAIAYELNRIVPRKEQDVFELMGDVAFQVVAKSLFSSNDIRQPMARLKKVTEENQRMLIKEMRRPFLKWWFRASGEIGSELKKSAEARTILNALIEERLKGEQNSTDLLDMLLAATYEDGSKMPREQLIDELLILFTAGHETTANALSFTLYFLAKNENLQEKLLAESLLLDTTSVTLEDLQKLPLIQSCINEAMRLYPPAYFIDRVAMENNEINGFELKKGTLVLLSLFELHRHEGFWKAPEDYIADRFLHFQDKTYTDYYYPFGAGPRMCIGNAFATFEMAMVVATLVKKYKITTSMDRIEINPMISLKPKEVKLQFTLR